jgi:hypothetical protein
MLLVAGAGMASLIGLNTACGIGGVHGVATCDDSKEDCGPFGLVGNPEDAGQDGGTDAGLDAGEDAGTDGGPDASGPFGLFPNGDGGSDAG